MYASKYSLIHPIGYNGQNHACNGPSSSKKASSYCAKKRFSHNTKLKNRLYLNASLLSNQEKLALSNPSRLTWYWRQEFIHRMIEREKVNPNSIAYHHGHTPLYESVLWEDACFTRYLLAKGVRVTDTILNTPTSAEISRILRVHQAYQFLVKRVPNEEEEKKQ